MRLIDVLKIKQWIWNEQSEEKIDLKTQLDLIQKTVFTKLKPMGFKKHGRTFNKNLGDGIVHVINFQSGQYPIGESYVIPGIRESLYGKFTINLGVCVDSLFKLQNPKENIKYYKEYDCQIRSRLGTLLKGKDYWWTISIDNNKITKEIISGFETKGFEWFKGLETKEKIINNLGHLPYNSSPRAKLDVALLVWFNDKSKGLELFKQYNNSIPQNMSGHKNYVANLAKELNIKL